MRRVTSEVEMRAAGDGLAMGERLVGGMMGSGEIGGYGEAAETRSGMW